MISKSFIFLFFALSLKSFGIPRTNWILEQLSTPVGQASIQGIDSKFRCSANLTNYSDAFSGMVGALADLGPLEIAGYASQRFFGNFTDAGREYKEASQQDSDTLAGEIARAYMTRQGHFGRLSAQYIYFPKNKSTYTRLGVNMGVFEYGDSPWVLRLNTHLYFPKLSGPEIYSFHTEIGQTISQMANSRWRLGLFFGWTYRTRDEINPISTEVYTNEHMLFSVGPWLEYATNYYHVKLGIPWRVWLDKESYNTFKEDGTGVRFVHYPSEARIPDIQLQVSLFL